MALKSEVITEFQELYYAVVVYRLVKTAVGWGQDLSVETWIYMSEGFDIQYTSSSVQNAENRV